MPDDKEYTSANSDSDPTLISAELIYESNPKHSEPWQVGRRGSICEVEIRSLAADLLAGSVEHNGKRYAIHKGRAYCAQEHTMRRWHGYPVGWVEVPTRLARKWMMDGVLTNHDRKKYWETH